MMADSMKQCESCGSDIKSNSDFCSGCGRELSGIDNKTIARSKSSVFDFILIAGFIIIFTAIFFIDKGRQAAGGSPPPESMNKVGGTNNLEEIFSNLPQDYKELVKMGNSLMDRNHYPVAIECYRRALAIDSSDPAVVCDLGSCLHATSDYAGAIEMFEKALVLDSTHAIAHFNLGIVYRVMDNKEKAKFYWEKLIALYPDKVVSDSARKYIERLDL
jgi:tetratricopeptide (TPR) repeat protein